MRLVFLWLLLITWVSFSALTDTTCFPQCRTGYVCYKGECMTLCNPPCSQKERCGNNGECVPINDSTVQGDQSCSDIFIIRPTIDTKIIPGELSEDELLNNSSSIADAVASVMGKGVTVIFPSDADVIDKCKAKFVEIRVKSYHKEPARLGQYIGCITVSITLLDYSDRKPLSVIEISEKGKLHWGDYVPFQNAVDKLCKRICYELKYKNFNFQMKSSIYSW